MTSPSERRESLLKISHPWDNNENIIWLASTLHLTRNIEKFKFPQKLDTEKKKQILPIVVKALGATSQFQEAECYNGAEISPLEKEFIIEHFLLFEGFQELDPGSCFYVDRRGDALALINCKDHIRLQITDCSGDLETSWSRLSGLENEIAKSISFAFLPRFGYLTSDPARSGTGLVISAFLHMPALIHTKGLAEYLDKEKAEGLFPSGLQGNPDDFIGDILMIRNFYTLGMNEETIISTLRNSILRLVVAEKGARSSIKHTVDPHIKDLISRALGLLKFSYQLETTEALSALSLLKLGVELDWIRGISIKEINQLFFQTRRAHLSTSLGLLSIPADMSTKRAEFLHQKLKSIELAID